MKKITIETVARKAGVSTATVSYVLSGKKKISREVTDRINEAIEDLGYKPSAVARNLASRKTWTVGLYTSPTRNIRDDIFFNPILAGILDKLHEKKYQLHLFADYLTVESEQQQDLSINQPIDGAIIMNPRVNDAYLDYLKRQDIPSVVMGTPSDPERVFYVDVDLMAAAYSATRYLLDKGHSRILFINGPSGYMQCLQHIQGSEMAFRESGLSLDPSDVKNIPMEEEASFNALLEIGPDLRRYTAVLAFHDVFSFGIIRYLKENRIQIPQDLAYLSLGNSPFCRICTPTLTSIDLAPYEMGYQSAGMLIDVVEKKRLQPSHTIVPVSLVERESV